MTESIPTFDNPDNSPLNIDERPTLLKVLCILSWIGAGFQIFVSTLYSLFINDTVKQKMFDILPSDEMVSMYKEIFNLMDKTSIWYLTLYLINIVFVYMMWNLKKIGFYGYTIIQVFILFVPFTVNPFNLGQLVVSLIFPIIFIVLYGMNLKHMKD